MWIDEDHGKLRYVEYGNIVEKSVLKSIVKNTKNEIKSKPYPKLMIHEDRDLIILVTRMLKARNSFNYVYEGFVINPGSSTHEIGKCFDGWIVDLFKDFHGSVTLEQD